ncbi:MAG TPA: PIG-L family deacetylase [Opitutaceae bacterium]|nr:PIG-L family deacetylase [Opitutaceae bacterium]
MLASLAAAEPAPAPSAEPAQAILQDLCGFREMGSVLYIAAHPDDENTQLITYLARGRCYRTAYMSLTRGDGGQNVLGPEFGDELGVIRTQELLAARRIDGGRQFFSRARDFGYSKDYRDTLTKWDRQQVLSDVVRVIRTFRPDVVVTRFPPEPGNTHGHHTASAVLALEAFGLAGDPKAFPEQLGSAAPWQPKRILWNGWGPNFGTILTGPGILRLAIDGTDPVTGASFATIAARSRSMHRTQGFANFSVAAAGGGPRFESFKLLGGEPAARDIMDGVDTTWGRVPGGAEIGRLAGQAIEGFNPAEPSASVPILLAIRGRLASLSCGPVVDEKRRQLDVILQACLGLSVGTTVPSHEIVPGESLKFRHTAIVRSAIPVRWLAVRYPGVGPEFDPSADLRPNEAVVRDAVRVLPVGTPLTQPYWLREEGAPGMFRVGDSSLIGLPESPPAVPIEDVFLVGGQPLVVMDEAVQAASDPAKGAVRRRLDVIPPVSLGFSTPVELFAPGASRTVAVDVISSRAGAAGTLRLVGSAGWRASPDSRGFRLAAAGDRARLSFTVTAPNSGGTGSISARAEVDGATFGSQRVSIDYGHIPPQILQPPARLKVVGLELGIRGRRVGYLPGASGASDSVAGCLEQMGYKVTELTGADLTAEGLEGFDAVVVGVRAFNTRTDLAPHLPALFAYAEAGGTVVAQYATPGGLQVPNIAPFELKLARDLPHYRVTNEHAPVELLEAGHPAFTTPNRIVAADFDGWVQERGLDFASEWDTQHFTPLLACSDSGEAPLKGGLLVARCGRGYYVYTGLSFFRQLPAGVPGAYRLFANLVSLGR